MRVLSKEQIIKCIEHMRRTFFGHFKLYMVCLAKKQVVENKKIMIFQEVP